MSYSVYQIRQAAEKFGVSFKIALLSRLGSLRCKISQMEKQFDEEDHPVLLHWMAEDIKVLRQESLRIKREVDNIDKPVNGEQVTDEMIARAKEYPIEKLIDFDRTGKALAFCHADKTPSLSWWKKGNKCTCFPCDKRFDPIDVLTERDGFTFYEAVKRLQ